MRRIREAIARRLALNPTSDLWRMLLAGTSEIDPEPMLADLARLARDRLRRNRRRA